MSGRIIAAVFCCLIAVLISLAANQRWRAKHRLQWFALYFLSAVMFLVAAWLAFPSAMDAVNAPYSATTALLASGCIEMPVFVGVASNIVQRMRRKRSGIHHT